MALHKLSTYSKMTIAEELNAVVQVLEHFAAKLCSGDTVLIDDFRDEDLGNFSNLLAAALKPRSLYLRWSWPEASTFTVELRD